MAGARRGLIVLVVGALVVGAVVADPRAAAGAARAGDPPVTGGREIAPIAFDAPPTRSAEGIESVAADEPTFTLPEPGVHDVALTRTFTEVSPVIAIAAPLDGTPPLVPGATTAVEEAARDLSAASDESDRDRTRPQPPDEPRVRVEILGQEEVRKLGADALAFRVERVDRGRGAVRAGLRVRYEELRGSFGGEWSSRLRLVERPACSLTRPDDPACWVERVLPTRNDLEAGAVVVDATEIADPRAADGGRTSSLGATDGGGSVLTLSAGASGPEGDYAATPLASTGEWTAGTSSGDFTWSYDVPLPPAVAGPVPDLTLGYSSQAVDGMTSFSNSQPGWVGLGWTVPEAFIERRFRSCTADGGSAQDLCWYTDGAGIRDHLVLSMDGRASRLVLEGGAWRSIDNPAWRIGRGGGAANGDDDGEWWEVTTEDGTRYRFGLSRNDATGEDLQSAWWVPVTGNHPGEPGYPGGQTVQAWRWNLDKVTDANGNTMLIHRHAERNHYGALGLPYAPKEYVRGGHVTRIDYGLREDDQAAAPPARVTFDAQPRCWTLAGCPEPSKGSPGFLDVPVDLLCSPAQLPCTKSSPSFFTTRFLRSIETAALTVFGYGSVDRVDLAFAYPDNGEGTHRLFLRSLQRTGFTGGTPVVMPATRFDSFGSLLPNRTYPNPGAGVPAMRMFRVDSIRDELGGAVDVSYTQPHPCPWPAKESGWDANTFDCFPQWGNPGGGGQAGWAAYNKWLVSSVSELDRTIADSPQTQTTYEYVGSPAWHHDDDPTGSPSTQSWSGWRGYGTVVQHDGWALFPHAQSHTEHRFFRGMHGDPLVGGGSKTDTVANRDGSGRVADHDWLAGLPAESTRLTFTTGDWIDATRHTYTWSNPSLDRFAPRWTRPESVTRLERSSSSWGGVRHVRERFGYDGNGQVLEAKHDGDVLDPTDDRCVITPRLQGPTGIVDKPRLEELWVRGSGSTGDVCWGANGAVPARRTELLYDGDTTGAAPTRGNPTSSRSFDGYGGAPETQHTYDEYGRVTASTDARGATTRTSYWPDRGYYPGRVTVTDAKGHRTVTDQDVGRGVPTTGTDANGRVTVQRYDGIGRLTDVWKPSESAWSTSPSGPPSYRFSYGLDATPWGDDEGQRRAAPVVCSQRLVDDDPEVFVPSCVVSDGLGRERQTQTRAADETGSAADELLVSTTAYDVRGLVAAETTVPYRVSPAPRYPGMVAVTGPAEAENQFAYDDVGRRVVEAFVASGSERWRTTTIHDGSATTVVPPAAEPGAGETSTGKTRTFVDAFGQTIAVDEFVGPDAFERTSHTYTPRGELATTVDAQGNVTAAEHDWLGRRLALSDPDQGRSTSSYDANGNVVTTTDALGRTTWVGYDELNRPVERRRGDAAGALLAAWGYDAPGELGLADYTSTFDGGSEYRTDVAGYDHAGRPIGKDVVVPGNELTGSLAGTYRYGYAYGAGPEAGPNQVTYPAAGGLDSETVRTERTNLDLPSSVAGVDGYRSGYVSRADYDPFGRLVGRRSGADPHEFVRTYGYEPGTGRLSSIRTSVGASLHQDDTYRYGSSHLTSVEHAVEGQRECFRYDERSRLAAAWTSVAPACEHDRPAAGAGPDPYSTAWRYSEIGNLLAVTEGTTTDTSTHPPAGAARPHAVTGTAANNNGEFTPVDPARIVDTRTESGSCRSGGVAVPCARIPAGGSLTVQVGGEAGVPATNVSAVAVNLTTTNSVGSGHLTVHAAGGARPPTSNLNFDAGANTSNGAVVKVPTSGADRGRITIYASAETDVILDVSGYHAAANGPDGGSFHPIDGQRVLDTRSTSPSGSCWNGSSQVWCARIPAGGTVAVAVAGQGDVPATGVSAVAANITAVGAAGIGYVSAWADGDAAPETSNVNYGRGEAVAGLSMVKVGANGRILLSSPTEVDVVVDVQGWYTTAGDQSGSSFTPHGATARRLVDTRSGSRSGRCPSTTAGCVTIPAGGELVVKAVGTAGVPSNQGVSAVAVNVTATGATGDGGFLTLYADGSSRPSTSNVNYGAGKTVSNAAIVRAGDNGNIRIYAERQTDVVIDVQGWYRAPTRAKTFAYDATGSLCWEAQANVAEPRCDTPPGGATTYRWDHQNRLEAVTSPAGTSRYVYDAAGQRILRVDPPNPSNGDVPTTTLYLENMELTLTPDGVAASRYYLFGSTTVAMRHRDQGDDDTTLTWLGGTDQGSVSIANQNGTGLVERRSYRPYGAPRGDGDLGTDRGFLGQTEDGSTGLVYLNARYYNASLGRFISVDPIADPTRPQSLNPYAYAYNNPIALSDPTGLSPLDTAPGALRAAMDAWIYSVLWAFGELGKLGPAPTKGRGRVLQATQQRNIMKRALPVAFEHRAQEIHRQKVQYCAERGTVYDGVGTCGVWTLEHQGGWRGAIVNVAGGLLAANPLFLVAELTAGAMGRPIDLTAFGVDPSSNWYKGGFLAGLVIDVAIPVGGAIKAAQAARMSARAGALPAADIAVIGKTDDLARYALRPGERTLIDRLPNLGSPRTNWTQNSSVLRQEMSRGVPIRDVSIDGGELVRSTGFLRAERDLLASRGWTFDGSSGYWFPPAG